MKISYDSLKCPHCGSHNFNLISEDVFLCDYCQNKFNYSLEEIDFSAENKVFRDELKECFEEKVDELNSEKCLYYAQLRHYRKLAYPKIYPGIFIVLAIMSVIMLISSLVGGDMFFVKIYGIGIAVFSVLFIASKIFVNYRYKKYIDRATFYAEKVVNCESAINAYVNLISKLVQ